MSDWLKRFFTPCGTVSHWWLWKRPFSPTACLTRIICRRPMKWRRQWNKASVALIGMLRGEPSACPVKKLGLSETEDTVKISRHELPCAMANHQLVITVSAAAYRFIATALGLCHRGNRCAPRFSPSFDISADLAVLANTADCSCVRGKGHP